MTKKSKVFLLAAVLVMAFAQVAFPALKAVGPVNPASGFPDWYKDSLGQTVALPVPVVGDGLNAPTMIFDPPIPGNALSQTIGFGVEAFYWNCNTTVDIPGVGRARMVLGLEATFANGVATPGQQIVFTRTRFVIDTPVAGGTYVVTYPYGQKTFVVPAGQGGARAITDTVDTGIGAPGVFTGALAGDIGPLLRQVNPPPPAGWMGDGVSLATIAGGVNSVFSVVGPGVNVSTNLFTVSAKLFDTPAFKITRSTFTQGATKFAEVFATAPAPLPAGLAFTANLPGQAPQPLSRVGTLVFGRFQFPNALPALVTVTATATGLGPTSLTGNLVDVIIINQATYSVATKTLTVAATSTDSLATLRGFGWVGATAAGQPLAGPAGQLTVFNNVATPPASVTVRSALGGSEAVKTVILP